MRRGCERLLQLVQFEVGDVEVVYGMVHRGATLDYARRSSRPLSMARSRQWRRARTLKCRVRRRVISFWPASSNPFYIKHLRLALGAGLEATR